MAKPTPAMILVKDAKGKKIGEFRFHTVISESHEAQTEITKFPVQTGFNISNHAIRKNRKVVLEGVISNTIIQGSKTAYIYSSKNNQKTAFEGLEDLVQNATVCEVITNLGVYTPVVFNKFTTKQAAGMTDAMQFTISGEEIQVKSTINRTAPKVLNFTKVPEANEAAIMDRLNRLQFPIKDGMYIEQATAELGTDFVVPNQDNKGKTKNTTFICKGYDPVTQAYKYEVNIEDNGIVHPNPSTQLNLFAIAGKAATAASPCLVDGALDIATDVAEDLVSTTMGDLRETAYGFKRDLIRMGGGPIGQALVGLGVDCAVTGLEAGFDAFADQVAPDSAIAAAKGLPTTQHIIDQLTIAGTENITTPIKKFTMTKISGFGGGLF